MASSIQSPEQELRFTRARQSLLFWLLAAVFAAATVTLLATSAYRDLNPLLPHPLWALLPLGVAVFVTRLAVRMTRHAYLILTPLGIEIFPLFRPEKGLNLVFWQEVAAVEVNPEMTRLTLHHNAERTSGIHLSLRPIPKNRRDLLVKAVRGRIAGSPGDLDS